MVHSQLKTYMQENVLEALAWLANKYQAALNVVASPDFHHEQFRIVSHLKSIVSDEVNEVGDTHGRPRRLLEKKLESMQTAQDNAS